MIKYMKNRDNLNKKEMKIISIKKVYQEKLKQGCPVSAGYKLDCEPNNVTDFSQNFQMMEASGTTTTNVRDFNNVIHKVSITDFKTMCLELGFYISTLRQKYWNKVDEIQTLTTDQEVSDYNINTSW